MPDQTHDLDPKVLEFLVCPLSKQPLRYDRDASELISDAAGLAFPIRHGIPIMLADEARSLDGPADPAGPPDGPSDGPPDGPSDSKADT